MVDLALTGHPDVPVLRGWSHQIALILAVPAGIALVLLAGSPTARVSAAVYATSLIALFTTSTIYHRVADTPRGIVLARRFDHAMIFVLIAGSYTPVCALALPAEVGIPALVAVWATAAVGIVMKFRVIGRMNQRGSWLYHAMGWVAVLLLPFMVSALGPTRLALLGLSGLLYTVGASFLAWRPRDLIPGVFGYHEWWHAFVVAASACHFALVASII